MGRNTVFSQLTQLICRNRFKKSVDAYNGDRYTKSLSCWQQLLVLLFAQSKGLDSLRDIAVSLGSHRKQWYHLGLVSVARSTLSDANNKRDAGIFECVFHDLLAKCRELSPRHGFKFKNPLYSFDSTLINVCLSLHQWATYRKKKGAFKLHTLLDHAGYLPSFVVLSDGNTHDITVMKDTSFGVPNLPPDSILLIDRAYIDYTWLHSLARRKVFFVIKVKSNMRYTVLGQQNIPKNKGVVSDCLIRLAGHKSRENYPDTLRLVSYLDQETGDTHQFVTNNLKLAARTIADLYKSRWQIEIFFKWIKQNLKIKSFLGTSKNAVMTQVWAAMIYYLLLSFIKSQTKCRHSLHDLAHIFSELLLDSVCIVEILTIPFDRFKTVRQKHHLFQLSLRF